MDSLKDIADGLENLLYEVLGLLVPGSAVVFAIAGGLGSPWWEILIQFVSDHPWLSFGGAYVLGYPVQSVSRPVTTLFAWLCCLPFHFILALIGAISPRLRRSSLLQLYKLRSWLLGRHTHLAPDAPDSVSFLDCAATYWSTRLGLPEGKRLSPRQIQDLSFSVLLNERKRLDRFRAVTSLTRGVAVAVVIGFILLVYQLWRGVYLLNPSSLSVIGGLLVAFYGLMERADMYHRLWHTILQSQFLSTISQERSIAGTTTAASSEQPISQETHHV